MLSSQELFICLMLSSWNTTFLLSSVLIENMCKFDACATSHFLRQESCQWDLRAAVTWTSFKSVINHLKQFIKNWPEDILRCKSGSTSRYIDRLQLKRTRGHFTRKVQFMIDFSEAYSAWNIKNPLHFIIFIKKLSKIQFACNDASLHNHKYMPLKFHHCHY